VCFLCMIGLVSAYFMNVVLFMETDKITRLNTIFITDGDGIQRNKHRLKTSLAIPNRVEWNRGIRRMILRIGSNSR